MSDDLLAFGSPAYLLMLALLLFARGMDILSTRVATPNLILEGNPLARKMGWKLGILVNLVLCFTFAFWPLTAIIVITVGLLVAARNFHSAWLMRSLGEEEYRRWFAERISQARPPLYLFCLFGETFLTALVGGALIYFSGEDSVPFAIGFGIITYAVVILFYTSLSLWRIRRQMG